TTTVRSVFVIGPDKKVKLTLTYPQSTGRNFVEILRVIDSLQLTAAHKVSTPVNWAQGDDVIIIPAVSDEEAWKKFPHGWRTLKPSLRTVRHPASPSPTPPSPASHTRRTSSETRRPAAPSSSIPDATSTCTSTRPRAAA